MVVNYRNVLSQDYSGGNRKTLFRDSVFTGSKILFSVEDIQFCLLNHKTSKLVPVSDQTQQHTLLYSYLDMFQSSDHQAFFTKT
jgi:hypothetical protein